MLDKQIQIAWIGAQRIRRGLKEFPGLTWPRRRFWCTLRGTRTRSVTRSDRVYREPRRWVMIRFEKKGLPRQASDPGPDPLSRFANHGIRGIHGKGAPSLVGSVSVSSVCSPAVATRRRSHLSPDGGSLTRHPPPLGSGWLRFDSRRFAFPAVATCRQTVEALLAHPPPLGSGWLRFDSRRFAFSSRSHLSPDGGCFTRHAPPLGSGWLRFDSRRFAFPAVGTCRQTVEALLATHHRLAADGYDSAADGYDSAINPGGPNLGSCMVGKSKPQICAK